MRLAITVSALVLLPLADIAGQGIDLAPGARVRVSSTQFGYRKDVATVSQVRGDSLVLLFGTRQTTVAVADLSELQVANGTRSAILPSAVLGGVGGFVGGAVLGLALHEDCDGCWFETTPSEDALIVGSIGAVAGFLGGAFVGSFKKRDRWSPVRLVPAGVSVAPTASGGIALSVSRIF